VGVSALVAVEPAAPVGHDGLGVLCATEGGSGEDLPLQAGEDRPRCSVVKARANRAHRLRDVQLPAEARERLGSVGRSAVGVEGDASDRVWPPPRAVTAIRIAERARFLLVCLLTATASSLREYKSITVAG